MVNFKNSQRKEKDSDLFFSVFIKKCSRAKHPPRRSPQPRLKFTRYVRIISNANLLPVLKTISLFDVIETKLYPWLILACMCCLAHSCLHVFFYHKSFIYLVRFLETIYIFLVISSIVYHSSTFFFSDKHHFRTIVILDGSEFQMIDLSSFFAAYKHLRQ